jgi:hypothetical protein
VKRDKHIHAGLLVFWWVVFSTALIGAANALGRAYHLFMLEAVWK